MKVRNLRRLSFDSKLHEKNDEKKSEKLEKLRSLLNKVSGINENLQSENEKISKQIIQLVQLLQSKDKQLVSINKENQKYHTSTSRQNSKREFEHKLLIHFLKFLVKKKFNSIINIKWKSFFIWKLKSTLLTSLEKLQLFFKNELKVMEIENTKKIKSIRNPHMSLGVETKRLSFLTNMNIAKEISNKPEISISISNLSIISFNFSFLNLSKFLTRISEIFNDTNTNLVSKSFYQLLKFSYFSVVKSKMLIFKQILINKKLKYILNQKYIKSIKRYFDSLKIDIILLKFGEYYKKKLNSQIQSQNSQNLQNSKNLIFFKLCIKFLSKNCNIFKIKFSIEKWKNYVLEYKSLEQINLINSYKNIEDEFSGKISEIEKAYDSNIGDILRKNKDLDKKLREASKEIEKYKRTIDLQIETIEDQTDIIEKSKSEDQGLIQMKDKINILHEKYENKLESLISENEKLINSSTDLSHNLKNEKIQNKELEKKIILLTAINEKLNLEMSEIIKKHENLKLLSAQSADELIKTNQETTKLRSEHKFLTEAKNNLTINLEKINLEISSKDRVIKQLKLNEDTLHHQFQMEREKIENKFMNEKNNLLDKIDLLEKDKDMTREQIKNLNKEIKNLNEKLRGLNDYSTLKKEVIHLRDKVVCFENENTSVRLQNLNLQKQVEGLIDAVATENRKFEITKLELEELRNLSKDSKEDLKKALEEMEGYANLLVQFEEKIKQAEEAKNKAIEEKEKAEEEVKTIRQRYINILGVRDL